MLGRVKAALLLRAGREGSMRSAAEDCENPAAIAKEVIKNPQG